MIFNIIFIDDKRHSLYPMFDKMFDQIGFSSIISNFIFNKKTGDLLYNDKFSIQRDEKNFMLENPSAQQLIKNYRGEEYRKNGLYKKIKKGNTITIYRNLTSLNKTLSSMYDIGASEVSIIQNQIDAAKKNIMDSFTTEAKRLTKSFATERKKIINASKGETANLSESGNYSSETKAEIKKIIDSFTTKEDKQGSTLNEIKSEHINIYTKIFRIICLKIDALIRWVKSERNELEKQVKEKFDQYESGIKTPKTKWLEIERSNLENQLKTDFDEFEFDIQKKTSYWFETEKKYVENIELILGGQNNSFNTSVSNKTPKKRNSKKSLNPQLVDSELEALRKRVEEKIFGKSKNKTQQECQARTKGSEQESIRIPKQNKKHIEPNLENIDDIEMSLS